MLDCAEVIFIIDAQQRDALQRRFPRHPGSID
jgi:hypothetical protein